MIPADRAPWFTRKVAQLNTKSHLGSIVLAILASDTEWSIRYLRQLHGPELSKSAFRGKAEAAGTGKDAPAGFPESLWGIDRWCLPIICPLNPQQAFISQNDAAQNLLNVTEIH